MAKFFISGVYKDNHGVITHVFIHSADVNNKFGPGTKKSEGEVINLLKAGNSIWTITWDYVTSSWQLGSLVKIISSNTTNPYVRTFADKLVADNLDNLIRFNNYI